MKQERVRKLREWDEGQGPVIYWMSRDQRVYDNWALVSAIRYARQKGRGVCIFFHIDSLFFGHTLRQIDFIYKSISEVAREAASHNIGFHLCTESRESAIEWILQKDPTLVVTDFSPLHFYRQRNTQLIARASFPVLEVDAHNIIPAWIVSQKQEFQAATLRPKIKKILSEYLDEYPEPSFYTFPKNSLSIPVEQFPSFEHCISPEIRKDIAPVLWITPWARAALSAMEHFITNKLVQYSSLRNDPNAGAQSELSPYLNHGNLSPQRLVLEVLKANMPEGIADDFLEESIIRREVAENYCLYCEQYDRFEWAWKWAQETLLEHWNDEREWVYSLSQFEGAQTHDSLWNAAQRELIIRGKLHGFMRMYWAKKILEWTESPRLAVEIALYLNDTYAIDGCDPNGYTGIMWSICGIHDRPWFDRPVYGKIRYMNRSGCEKKFNVVQYIQKWNALL